FLNQCHFLSFEAINILSTVRCILSSVTSDKENTAKSLEKMIDSLVVLENAIYFASLSVSGNISSLLDLDPQLTVFG
ncbi:MAG: hypothetical protein MHPSP_001759, partial [Paramarteilia canceri]